MTRGLAADGRGSGDNIQGGVVGRGETQEGLGALVLQRIDSIVLLCLPVSLCTLSKILLI